MPNLATLDLSTTLQGFRTTIACAHVLFAHVDQAQSLPYQGPFHDILNYMIGEMEKCASAAFHLQSLKLAAAVRSLFELSFTVDYVCTSDQSMDRFIVDAAIDELEIMEKFLALDSQDPNYEAGQNARQRELYLRQQIANANLTGSRPLQTFEIARAVNRESDYRQWYSVYSKMTHATGWAILGRCPWERMAVLLLMKAEQYSLECIKRIAQKVGLPANTPTPTL